MWQPLKIMAYLSTFCSELYTNVYNASHMYDFLHSGCTKLRLGLQCCINICRKHNIKVDNIKYYFQDSLSKGHVFFVVKFLAF